MASLRTLALGTCLLASLVACHERGSRLDTPKESEPTKAVAPEQKAAAPVILSGLDADGNGLYDDVERKQLLAVLKTRSPQLKDVFDADGDGRVTIEEQTEGTHPISMLIDPNQITQSNEKIPWGIDIFPEWIMTAYFQEDVPQGPVADQQARGVRKRDANQPSQSLQPSKTASGEGVQFAENSGQYLSMTGERDARWNYRWCIFTFRIDSHSGTDERTVLVDLNKGDKSGFSSPKIWYDKNGGLFIQYLGSDKGKIDKRVMVADNVVADGKTWNVVVCGIRYGRMFASVNGVVLSTQAPQPPRFACSWAPHATSYIGDTSKGNMAWAYDALIFGQTELSQAMVRKMTGWAAHRLGFASHLPADHPYRVARPVLDAEDFPYRYVHDNERWQQWGQSLDKQATRVNAGGQRVEHPDFERVFYDDFRADRAEPGDDSEADLWTGSGFNVSVGMDAKLIAPGQEPNAYPYDAKNHQQIISLVPQGKNWRGSALYSVNDMGHGYTWTGPKIFRIRCMFPKMDPKDVPGGLFPAFWSYSPEWLEWRTTNRIEVDWFEIGGENGRWYNGLSSHYHYAHVKNIFAKHVTSYKRYKMYSGELTKEKANMPSDFFLWDGRFHTWEFVVDDDMTYVNLTVADENGDDQWVEVCRAPTAPTYLQRLDLQWDYALKAKLGLPPAGQRQDFVVDWIEVLQKPRDIEKLPAIFTARPQISGSTTPGSTIVCQPNVQGVTDIRYYWFADGYPLTYGTSNTYTVTSELGNRKIRCMVKAVGARDMPEAWSNIIP